MPKTMHSFDSNSSTVPAFLVKLWKLVGDATCDDLIAWNDSGYSFIIKDQAKFAKELLPQYFKHNNMASFIRQLNMYGFKKVMNFEKSGLKNENTEMEFQHGFFVKNRGELLELIKRKISNPKVVESSMKSNPKDILIDLSSIREKQENMDSMLLKMKHENELLWRELTSMRQKHKAQEQIIQRVIQFLVSIVQRSNSNIGVQRKMTRMLQNSSTSKANSSQVSQTIDVLRKNNSDCIIVPDQVVSPLGPVIHEVTDGDQEENTNSAASPLISVRSPLVTSPSPLAKSADSMKKPNKATKTKYPLVSILNNPSNSSVAMTPLSILEALQPRTPAANSDDVCESILGIPLEYISIPDNSQVTNVISIPQDNMISNVISIPEDDEIGSVISIPEDGSISDIISLPEGSSITNAISIPEETVTDNCTSVVETNPYIASFSDLQASTSTDSVDSAAYSLLKNDFGDDLLSESLQTPKIETTYEDGCSFTYKDSNKNKIATKNDRATSKSITHNEHNYQLATSDSSSLVKNVLSNHLLSVDEKLNFAQDRLASNPWNLDVQSLLGLFSNDDINYDAFTSELSDDINMKSDSNDIIGNELVQFNPNILEVDMDLANSPLFEALAQGAEVPCTDYESESLLDEVLNETVASEGADLLPNQIVNSSPNKRHKVSKPQRAKHRRVK